MVVNFTFDISTRRKFLNTHFEISSAKNHTVEHSRKLYFSQNSLIGDIHALTEMKGIRTAKCSDYVFIQTENFSDIFSVQKFILRTFFVIIVMKIR